MIAPGVDNYWTQVWHPFEDLAGVVQLSCPLAVP